MSKGVEKIVGKEVSRRYPHVKGKYQYAGQRGHINRSKIDGDRHYLYHLDETFERWQAKYLSRREAGSGSSRVSSSPAQVAFSNESADGSGCDSISVTGAATASLPPCFDELISAYKSTREVHAASIVRLYDGEILKPHSGVHPDLLDAFSVLVNAHQEVGFLIDKLMQSAGLDGLHDFTYSEPSNATPALPLGEAFKPSASELLASKVNDVATPSLSEATDGMEQT